MPKRQTILEVLDGAEPDQDLFRALTKLFNRGHRFAIADSLIRKSDDPLASIANIIKLDFAELARPAIENRLETLKKVKSRVLADHVETHDNFEFARDLGFDYFRGRFFCKPHITTAEIPLNRLATTRLVAELRDPLVDVQELGQIISQDLALAYQVLEFANSAYVGLARKVDSIDHCVNMVGIERIRNWASLMLFSKIEDKPRELMIVAVVRAMMCEALGETSNQTGIASFFTVGLFSVLDAILDCPMRQALDALPLSDEVCDALIDHRGPSGEVLRCVLAYEKNDWKSVKLGNLTGAEIRDHYLDSVGWTQTHPLCNRG